MCAVTGGRSRAGNCFRPKPGATVPSKMAALSMRTLLRWSRRSRGSPESMTEDIRAGSEIRAALEQDLNSDLRRQLVISLKQLCAVSPATKMGQPVKEQNRQERQENRTFEAAYSCQS